MEQSIAQLKDGIDAAAVVLLDRRSSSVEGHAALPKALGDVLGGLPCLAVDWAKWCEELLEAEQLTTTCGCSDRHQLHGLAIERRWLLAIAARGLVAPDGSFEPTKALPYAEWAFAIRFFLTEETASGRRPGSPGRGGGGPVPAELAIPLSWYRKSRE